MKFPPRRFLELACLAIAATIGCVLWTDGGWSQTSRTIRFVVPLSPGGVGDFLARILAEQIRHTQGVSILIENRPGAGGAIGAEAVARAAPDGTTLLINSADLLVGSHLRKLNYDPMTSFEPVCHLVNVPTLILVNSASPYRTLADLLAAARARPRDLTMASFGPATMFQIGLESLKRASKADITFVPYPGVAPAINALLGDHVTSAFATYSTAAEQLNAGKLRALAVASPTRTSSLPDVPTVAESGYRDYAVEQWFGVDAPARTAKPTIDRLADWFTTAMQVDEVKEKLVAQGLFPVGTCGTEFAAFIRKQFDEFGRVIREANIKAE